MKGIIHKMGKNIADSFETIEGITKGVGNAAQKGIADIGSDVVEAITGNVKPLPVQQKTQIKQDDTQKAQVIRQNIAKMDQEIIQIRKKREEEYKQTQKEEKNPTSSRDAGLRGARKESVLAKLIKSRKGTKEGMQRASG